MSDEPIYFNSIKEDRGPYYVEYRPPLVGNPFATVSLTFPDSASPQVVASRMEAELQTWIDRYGVAVFVSAFDAVGDVIPLEGVRASNHLVGWAHPETSSPVLHWQTVPQEQFPVRSYDAAALRKIFAAVPFRTKADFKAAANKHRRIVRFGWWLVFLWAVAIPAAIAIIEFNAPDWLAWLLFSLALGGVCIDWLKLSGKWPKTERDVRDEDEERRMKHHHYHCDKNPEGFERLKRENFEREAREGTRKDAAALRVKREGVHGLALSRPNGGLAPPGSAVRSL